LSLPAPSVTFAVTTNAKRNQVRHHVATELALAFNVMDLQALHGTALLTPPAVSLLRHTDPQRCQPRAGRIFYLPPSDVARENRDGLMCKLNSYAQPVEVKL
jgi:hypothetical protein